MKINPYLLTCFFIFLTSISSIQAKADKSDAYTSRKIEYSFTLQNTTNQTLKNVEFWAYAPVKETTTQKCESIKANYPYKLIADDFGNQILNFSFEETAPYSAKIVKIEATLLLSQMPAPIKIKLSGNYLKPQVYIESDDPQIKQLAAELKSPIAVKTAENIFKWICRNIKDEGFTENPRGALYALKNKKGDCTEQAYLFVALCRANNIPARAIAGYICAGNKVLKPGEYHNWVEFYLDGKWRVADPQKKVFMEKEPDYISMGVSEESCQFGFTSKGLKVTMNN